MTDSGGDAAVSKIPDYQPLPARARPDPAYRSPASWARYALPATLGLIADLWIKSWAFPDGVPQGTLPDGSLIPAGRHPAELFTNPDPVIPHFLGFTTTINHGAVFGIGQGMVLYFLLFSIVAMGVIIWVFLGSKRDQWTVHITLGMITAGALGNLYDRAVFNGVRDMFRFYVNWYPYIFNFADLLLCIGVPLLMLRWKFGKD
jgi:signal peptidase II